MHVRQCESCNGQNAADVITRKPEEGGQLEDSYKQQVTHLRAESLGRQQDDPEDIRALSSSRSSEFAKASLREANALAKRFREETTETLPRKAQLETLTIVINRNEGSRVKAKDAFITANKDHQAATRTVDECREKRGMFHQGLPELRVKYESAPDSGWAAHHQKGTVVHVRKNPHLHISGSSWQSRCCQETTYSPKSFSSRESCTAGTSPHDTACSEQSCR